jgi:hypothetical protein
MQREEKTNTYVFWSHECLFAQTCIDLWQMITTIIVANEWKDWTTIFFGVCDFIIYGKKLATFVKSY